MSGANAGRPPTSPILCTRLLTSMSPHANHLTQWKRSTTWVGASEMALDGRAVAVGSVGGHDLDAPAPALALGGRKAAQSPEVPMAHDPEDLAGLGVADDRYTLVAPAQRRLVDEQGATRFLRRRAWTRCDHERTRAMTVCHDSPWRLETSRIDRCRASLTTARASRAVSLPSIAGCLSV